MAEFKARRYATKVQDIKEAALILLAERQTLLGDIKELRNKIQDNLTKDADDGA